MSPFEIPVGVHVYTSDGVDAGVISSVAAKHFVVRTADGTAITMPLGMAERVHTGRLWTWINSEVLRIRFLQPVARKVS